MQPVTMSLRPAACFFSSAISRIVSIDSCLARSMNAQVFTTSTSACDASAVISCPSFSAMPSMTSESTRFFGHPSETNPIFMGTSQCSRLWLILFFWRAAGPALEPGINRIDGVFLLRRLLGGHDMPRQGVLDGADHDLALEGLDQVPQDPAGQRDARRDLIV